MRPLAIIGIGGHGREALDIVEAVNAEKPTWDVVGFIDDAAPVGTLAEPHDVPVIGTVSQLAELDVEYICAVGATRTRQRIIDQLPSNRSADLIHPLASIGSHVSHGPGLIMAAGARVTHAVHLGAHVHINVGATISHDCTLGDFVTVTPGVHVSGAATVGSHVWLGVGSSIIQQVSVGDDVTVGAGAAIISDIPHGATVVGVPGRAIKTEGEQ